MRDESLYRYPTTGLGCLPLPLGAATSSSLYYNSAKNLVYAVVSIRGLGRRKYDQIPPLD